MILDSTAITSILTTAIGVVGTAIGVVGGIFAIIERRTNQRLKHQEILFPLMTEFDMNKKIRYANTLIENIPIQLKHDNEIISGMPITLRYSDNENKVLKYRSDYLPFLLVGHRSNTQDLNQDEFIVREIFDELLNFFGKLGYLIDKGLITKKDLNYFLYYIELAKDNWAVIHFARDYNYELFAILLDRMEIIPADLLELATKYKVRAK